MEKKVFIVIEQGAGVLHKVFESKNDAQVFVDSLKELTGFEDYEIQEIWYQANM